MKGFPMVSRWGEADFCRRIRKLEAILRTRDLLVAFPSSPSSPSSASSSATEAVAPRAARGGARGTARDSSEVDSHLVSGRTCLWSWSSWLPGGAATLSNGRRWCLGATITGRQLEGPASQHMQAKLGCPLGNVRLFAQYMCPKRLTECWDADRCGGPVKSKSRRQRRRQKTRGAGGCRS